jgi:hypothetical protein
LTGLWELGEELLFGRLLEEGRVYGVAGQLGQFGAAEAEGAGQYGGFCH